MSNTTNPASQNYTGGQGQSYSYKPYTPTPSNTQSKSYTPSSYTSSYKTSANPSISDPKGGIYPPKSDEGQVSPSYIQSGGYTETSNKGYTSTNAGATLTAGVSANYRPYSASTDTASLTTENPSLLNASNTSQKPNNYLYNPSVMQPIYKELQQHLGGQVGQLVTGSNPTHLGGTDPPPNTNAYTSPLLKPTTTPSSYKSGGPLIKLDATAQDSAVTRDPNRFNSYNSYKKPEQTQQAYSSYNPTPSNTYAQGKDSKLTFPETRTIAQQGVEPNSYSGSAGYKPPTTTTQTGGNINIGDTTQTSPTRSYTVQPSSSAYTRDANKNLSVDVSSNINGNLQRAPLRQEGFDTNRDLSLSQNMDNINTNVIPLENAGPNAVDRTGMYNIKVVKSEEPQGQTVFTNPMFIGETERSDYREEYKIALTEPYESRRRSGGELAKSVVDIKYELPTWYEKDKDTGLYENMYLIDAIRYTNRRVIHHSPPRGSEKGLRASQMIGGNQYSPKHNDNYLNFSHKLETPRSAKKWDRHIPRVILFVHKYNAGEMEDDADEDMGQSLDYQNPSHTSPYYLETHQKVYHENNRPSQVAQRIIQQKQQQASSKPNVGTSRDGYFDVNQYITQSQNRGIQDLDTDIGFFEENEGVRQTIRVKEIPSRLTSRY